MPFVRQESGINRGFMQAFHSTSEGVSMSKSRHVPVVKQNTRLLDVHDLHKSQNSLLSPSHKDSAAALAACSAKIGKKMARSRGICVSTPRSVPRIGKINWGVFDPPESPDHFGPKSIVSK